MTPEHLTARAAVVRQTTAAIDALVLWELTQSTDLRRYERARLLLQQAFEIESRYGTRVADVDPDRHALAGNVVTRVVPDHAIMGDYIGPLTVRACRPGDVNDVDDTTLSENRLAVAEHALDGANRHMRDVEARLREAHQALNTLPDAQADAVINRVNDRPENPHWEGGDGPRFGAPYDPPPAIGGPANLADLATVMGVPHMRPLMQGMQAAMAPMMPDPITRLASRLTCLLDARAALLQAAESLSPGPAAPVNVAVLDRQIQQTQREIDQLEADAVPPNPHPGVIQ